MPDNSKSATQNLWDFYGGGGDPIVHETKEIKTVAICLGLGPFLPQVPWTIIIMMNFVENTTTSPRVTRVIHSESGVSGVTSLDDDVFIVRFLIPQVEVYDAVTFTLQHCLSLPGRHSQGLAVCASNKCLYASDYRNACVHRVELTGSNAVTKWSVGQQPAGLTVNSAKNVVVVIQEDHKLQEFTTHGTLLQTIQLRADIRCPSQVVQLSNGQFVISHGVTHSRVCLLDVHGAVVRSYGGTPGSDLTKLDRPRGLTVDKYGNILVADRDNNRLLVLERSLTSAHEMSVSVDGGLKYPFSLWYDKSRGRLYVGEWYGGRVIIIDHLKDFTASHT